MDDRPAPGPERAGPVEVVVPARSQHLRMCRLVCSGVASAAGLDIDQIDDLRIAVDELCSLLVELAGDAAAKVHLVVDGGSGEVSVLGRLDDAGSPGPPVLDPISQQILDGLDVRWRADEAGFELTAPRAPVA